MTMEARAGGSSLWRRVAAAVILVPAALGATYLGGWVLAVWAGAAGIAMSREWVRIVHREAEIGWRFGAHAIALVASQVLMALNSPKWAVVGILLPALIASIAAQRLGERAILLVAGILFIASPCLAFAYLRQLPSFGFDTTVWLLCVVWATDSAAYLAGSAFRGPKLAPAISPNKTWAGAIAGLLAGGVVTAVLAFSVGAKPGIALLGAGLALSLLTQCGDLAESFLKRTFGVKDASDLIPGHGGALDRLDGMVFATLGLTAFTLLAGFSPLAWAVS